MIKLHQLRITLRAWGFKARRGRGSHEVWTDPRQPQRRVVLYGKDSDDARKFQAARICKFRRGTMVYQHHQEREGCLWSQKQEP